MHKNRHVTLFLVVLRTKRRKLIGSSNQELLAKHFTEKPVTPRVKNPEVTEEFAGLVLKMMEKKKERRPKDFHEVLMAMRSMKIFKDVAKTS